MIAESSRLSFVTQKSSLEPLDPEIKAAIEKDFTISSPSGTNRVILTRKEASPESVTVIIDAGNPEWLEEQGEEEGEEAGCVHMCVLCSLVILSVSPVIQ